MNHRKSLLLFSLLVVFACSTGVAQVIKGTYAIKNVATGMLLRIKDANKKDGTPLVSYSPVNWKCMTWEFQHLEGQSYQLKNLFTGKTIQPNGAPAESVNLIQQPLANSPLQQYEFLPAGENQYLIRLKGTSLYLTPSDKEGAVNSTIMLAGKTDGNIQRWTIYEQHPEI